MLKLDLTTHEQFDDTLLSEPIDWKVRFSGMHEILFNLSDARGFRVEVVDWLVTDVKARQKANRAEYFTEYFRQIHFQ